jgi:multicomponent Na+:H+ antiporter subunit F
MNPFLTGAAIFLMLNLLVGLVRAWRGPSPADQMQALLLFGTTTVATLLLMAYATGSEVLVEVALIFVMLAAVGTITFSRLPRNIREDDI